MIETQYVEQIKRARELAAQMQVPFEVAEYVIGESSNFTNPKNFRIGATQDKAAMKQYRDIAKNGARGPVEEQVFWWEGVKYLVGFDHDDA